MSIKHVKEYWDKRPCNIKHSNKKIGSKEYFNEVSKRKYFVEPHILEFADFFPRFLINTQCLHEPSA